jgi:hypothetical protein
MAATASDADGVTGRFSVSNLLPRERHGADSVLRLAPTVSTHQPPDVQRRRARTEKSCGPDARSWRQALRRLLAPTGAIATTIREGDGGNRARLTGEITKEAVKTIRAGKAGRPGFAFDHPVCMSRARIAGASRRPAFPAPSASSGAKDATRLGPEGRENEKLRPQSKRDWPTSTCLPDVIASAAKQSRLSPRRDSWIASSLRSSQ